MTGKRYAVILAAVCMCVAVSDIWSADAARPAGFVARVSGKVEVLRSNSRITVSSMDLLYRSDVVSVPRGASVRINVLPGTGYEIAGEARVMIGESVAFTRGKATKVLKIDTRECEAAVAVLSE
ncbi:MAG TPA: hypothetical protein VF857_07660, partial [Spirochaetota bacterium]